MIYLDFDTNERVIVDLKAINVGLDKAIALETTVYDLELVDGTWLNAVVVIGVRKDSLEVAPITIQYSDLDSPEVYYNIDDAEIIFFNDIECLTENVFMKGLEYREQIEYFWCVLDDLYSAELNNPDDEYMLDDIEKRKGRIYRTLGRLEEQLENALEMAKGNMFLRELPTAEEIVNTYYNIPWYKLCEEQMED